MDTNQIVNAYQINTTRLASPSGNRGSEIRPDTSGYNSLLKAACEEFEGMLMGIILKQGLQSSLIDDEGGPGASIIREFAMEQAGRDLARHSVSGMADALYQQMTAQSQREQRH